MSPLIVVVISLLALAGGFVMGWLLAARRKGAADADAALAARKEAEKVLAEARRNAQTIDREAEQRAAALLAEKEQKFEETTRNRRAETAKLEAAAKSKDADLTRRLAQVKHQEDDVAAREAEIEKEEARLKTEAARIQALVDEQVEKLAAVAGLTRDEARAQLRTEIEESHRAEFQRLIKRLEEDARVNGKKEASRILSQAVEQAAPRYAAESTTTTVKLPAADLKGRIIGKEGRNIRSFEMVTGVDVQIDDAPDTIILASFNPLRREIARQTLEKLVEDGRIHPARIEETFEKIKRDFDEQLMQLGKDSAFSLGIHDLKDRPLLLLGRLKFRHSDGQNLLAHTLEVAEISGHLARLLELKPEPVKRAALYHDLGLVEDAPGDGTPLQVSIEVAKRAGETPQVLALIESLRDGAPATSAEAHLLRAAERLSFARPGALREGLEHHLGRLENLEKIATQFDGVSRAYALKSGKELVVIIDNAKVSDQNAQRLCEDLAARIHQEMRVDRGVRIAVIRETRAIDYAT